MRLQFLVLFERGKRGWPRDGRIRKRRIRNENEERDFYRPAKVMLGVKVYPFPMTKKYSESMADYEDVHANGHALWKDYCLVMDLHSSKSVMVIPWNRNKPTILEASPKDPTTTTRRGLETSGKCGFF